MKIRYIVLALILMPLMASAQSTWYPTGSPTKLTPAASTWGIKVPALSGLSCIGTDASGNFQSGTCGGGGGVSTSTSETNTYIPFWTSTNGTPALLSGGTSNLTWNGSKLFANYASTTALTSTGSAYFATSAGNVGIGTTSPSEKLEVSGGNIIIDNNKYYRTRQVNGTVLNLFGIDASNNAQLLAGSGGDINFAPNGGNQGFQMVIKQTSGNVGIGTTTPGANLNIYSSSAQDAFKVRANNGASWTIDQYSGLVHSSGPRIVYDSNVSAYAFSNVASNYITSQNGHILLMPNSGNVGIGTTGPGAKLHVSGGNILLDNNQMIQFKDSGGTARTAIQVDTGDNLHLNAGAAGGDVYIGPNGGTNSARFVNGGAVALGGTAITTNPFLYISNTGNVGIGTTTVGSRLTIQGGGSTSATKALSVLNSSATEMLTVLNNGNVGIGTTSPPSLFSVMKTPAGTGAIATTTVDFGDYATTTSTTCFNTKNTAGSAISFYFVGTSMIVENNRCK